MNSLGFQDHEQKERREDAEKSQAMLIHSQFHQTVHMGSQRESCHLLTH